MMLVITMTGIMNTEKMRAQVAKLYAKVFEFLRVAIGWYSSKTSTKIRFGLNENLYDNLREHVQVIQLTSDSIFQLAQTCGLAENRETRLVGEDTNAIARHTYVAMRDVSQKLSDLERKLDAARENYTVLSAPARRVQLGTDLFALLEGVARDQKISEISIRKTKAAKEQKLVFEVAATIERSMEGDDKTRSPIIKDIAHSWSVSDIFGMCEALDHFVIGRSGEDFAGECTPGFANEEVMHTLQQWSTASTSQLLWLAGPEEYTVPSNVSAAAGAIVMSAQALGVPQISHICERGTRSDSVGQSIEDSGLIGLLYSFIKQMIVQTPLRVENDTAISYDQISDLDGTMGTWSLGLDILSILLKLAPPLLLCIVDGFNLLDHGASSTRCEEFISLFWKSLANEAKVLKVLFTTSGFSKTMNSEIPTTFLMAIDEGRTRRRQSTALDGDISLILTEQYLV